MIKIRRRRHEVPALNTASLPDLIFTVLFFFIIVTHMREETVQVKYKVPDGEELAKVGRKSSVIHLYIGKPLARTVAGGYRLQLGNRIVTLSQLVDYVSDLRGRMQQEDAVQMTVAISADKDVDMQTVMDVKQALRQANVQRITYIGNEEK